MATQATARESILALQAQGKGYHEIGRIVGRNDSLIRQIALGKKPGNNLAGALNQVARGERPEAPPRRTVAGGKEARTRRPTVKLADGGEAHKYRGAKAARRELERAAAQDKTVKVYANARSKTRTVTRGSRKGQPLKVRVRIGGDDGIKARELLNRMGTSGGAGSQFAGVAGEEDGSTGEDDYYADLEDFDIVEYDDSAGGEEAA